MANSIDGSEAELRAEGRRRALARDAQLDREVQAWQAAISALPASPDGAAPICPTALGSVTAAAATAVGLAPLLDAIARGGGFLRAIVLGCTVEGIIVCEVIIVFSLLSSPRVPEQRPGAAAYFWIAPCAAASAALIGAAVQESLPTTALMVVLAALATSAVAQVLYQRALETYWLVARPQLATTYASELVRADARQREWISEGRKRFLTTWDDDVAAVTTAMLTSAAPRLVLATRDPDSCDTVTQQQVRPPHGVEHVQYQ